MDDISTPVGLVQYIIANWQDILHQITAFLTALATLLGTVVGIFSIITRFTKTPEDDKLAAKALNWVHQLSVTNAKNVKGIGQDDETK